MSISLGLLKPDCLERGIQSEVLAFIESHGLLLVKKRRLILTPEKVAILYESSIGRDYYKDMLQFLLSGPSLAYIVSCEGDAIARLNELVGYQDPAKADLGTVRRTFGESVRRNVTHSTKDEETLRKELPALFPYAELAEVAGDLMVGNA